MKIDLSKYRCQEIRAISDVDNFIEQQKKDGVTARHIIIGLSESIDPWLLVR